MNKNDILKVVYHYFPKGVDGTLNRKEYLNSQEYITLKDLIMSPERGHNPLVVKLKAFLEENVEKKFEIRDYSLFEMGDRCHNIQCIKLLEKKNIFHSICINLSVLFPFFNVHVLQTKLDENNNKWTDLPKRNKTLEASDYNGIIDSIKKFLNTLDVLEFPENLISEKIPDINLHDIPMGQFTFYNAFFLDNYYTRL